MEINNSLADSSRVWIYQSNRLFSNDEIGTLTQQLNTFVQEWASHSKQLYADAFVLHNRFIVLMVDENRSGASGCSIDASVRFLKTLEQSYNINLFDRFLFSYRDQDNQIHTVNSQSFSTLYKDGIITENTLVCDTLVNNKSSLKTSFFIPLSQSWHKRFI